MTSFSGAVLTTNNGWVDICSAIGITTGNVHVDIAARANLTLVTDNTQTEGYDLSVDRSFNWDASVPLYVYNNGGGSSAKIKLIVSPVASVGLSVNC